MTKEYTDLCDEVYEHRYRYYVLVKPIISDHEYDRLEKRLVDYEKKAGFTSKYSPTQKVGSDSASSYPIHIRRRF